MDPGKTYTAIQRALQETNIDPNDWVKLSGFIQRETPSLYAGKPSTVVLGSYREPYKKHTRIAAHELQRRHPEAYSIVVGDTQDPGIDPKLDFRLKLHLLCIYADYIAGIYEKDGGGEINELGTITDGGYFEKTWVFPRDYPWLTEDDIESKPDLHAATAAVLDNSNLSKKEKEVKINELIDSARKNGISTSKTEVIDTVRARLKSSPAVDWSWPNCTDFALYRKANRCYPWATEDDLRTAVLEIPKTPSSD